MLREEKPILQGEGKIKQPQSSSKSKILVCRENHLQHPRWRNVQIRKWIGTKDNSDVEKPG